jgi:hypothetical protein
MTTIKTQMKPPQPQPRPPPSKSKARPGARSVPGIFQRAALRNGIHETNNKAQDIANKKLVQPGEKAVTAHFFSDSF